MKSLRHRTYDLDELQWRKWRLVFGGGDLFIRMYLKRFTTRESGADFITRRAIAYNPAFAKQAIYDVRNAIFQRMAEVHRDGEVAYLEACKGNGLGVDQRGTSMTQFMGTTVLDELLTMAKVGVWIDNGRDDNNDHPYVYIYQIEDVYNWDDEYNPTSVLLRDYEPAYDSEFGVLIEPKTTFRHAQYIPGVGVVVKLLDESKTLKEEYLLEKFDRLPLVILHIKESLLKDIANYQIALLNLASADMSYAVRANFPFYTEQYDVRADAMQKMNVQPKTIGGFHVGEEHDTIGIMDQGQSGAVEVGVTNGRRYPMGTERPGFIAPPTEPLLASMEKQEQLKKEMRILVGLSLSNLSQARSSSDSKQEDEKGLEAGLSYIAQELARAERIIADCWMKYLGSKTPFTIEYPVDYSLKSDSDRQAEAENILKSVDRLPSTTAKRELVKQACIKLFGGRISADKLKQVLDEIERAEVIVGDPELLYKDVEANLVSNKTASMARGYEADESDEAIKDHVAKLSRIAIAQSDAAVDQQTPGVETTITEKDKKKEAMTND